MKIRSTKETGGFTIIEVMIVLAIAGLILAVVLLAVPALQRSQRNNARTSDATHYAGLVSDYASNHGGTLPTAAQLNTTNENFSQLKTFSVVSNNTTGFSETNAVIDEGASCSNGSIQPGVAGAFAVAWGYEAPGAPAAGTLTCIAG